MSDLVSGTTDSLRSDRKQIRPGAFPMACAAMIFWVTDPPPGHRTTEVGSAVSRPDALSSRTQPPVTSENLFYFTIVSDRLKQMTYNASCF